MSERKTNECEAAWGEADRIDSQAVHEFSCQEGASLGPKNRRILAALDASSKGICTAVQVHTLDIRLAKSPLAQNGLWPLHTPKDAYVYIFDDAGKLDTRAFSNERGEWQGKWMHEDKPVWPACSTHQVILDIDENATTAPRFWLFYSPVLLSDTLVDRLAQNYNDRDYGMIQVDYVEHNQRVIVMDPLEFAVNVHQSLYLPLLEKLQAFNNNEDRGNKVFIASVLKQWCEKDDADAKDELRGGQPDKWFDAHTKDELAVRRPAEAAAAQLADLVTSGHYRVVADACEENKGDDLEYLCMALALVTESMAMTLPGKMMLGTLATDKRYFPARYLFSEDAKSKQSFQTYRYNLYALMAIFTDLVPAGDVPSLVNFR